MRLRDAGPRRGFCGDSKTQMREMRILLELLTEKQADFRRSLDASASLRQGTASGKSVTVLAQAFISAGHALHHQRMLVERYFPTLPAA